MADNEQGNSFFDGGAPEGAPAEGTGSAPVDGVQTPDNPAPQAPQAPQVSVNLTQKVGDLFTEEMKNDSILSRYKDRTLQEFFQDTVEARKTMSSMVKVPPADADFSTKKEYLYGVMDKLGMEKPPVAPTDYQFDMSSLQEGQQEDPVLSEFARSAFYDAGLTNSQANKIIELWNKQNAKMVDDIVSERNKAFEAATTEFRKEWGDHYNANINAVARTVSKIFPATLVEKFKKANLDNDPELVRAIFEINKNYMSEHNVDPGMAGDAPDNTGLTNTEKMRKILSDPNWKSDVSLQKEYQRLAALNAQTHKKVVR